MRRIFAQARKELTQITRDRLALALALVLPVCLLLLLSTAISLTVTDMPIDRAGSRQLPGVARFHRRLPRVEHVPRRRVARRIDNPPTPSAPTPHAAR